MALSQIPSPSEPLVDPRGTVTRVWFQFLLRLVGAVGAGGAPADADYIVSDPDVNLPNARVATDSPTVTVDLTVPGVIRWHAVGGGGSWVPLSLGVEPLTFVSDGAGSPILVGYTP